MLDSILLTVVVQKDYLTAEGSHSLRKLPCFLRKRNGVIPELGTAISGRGSTVIVFRTNQTVSKAGSELSR
jgi:hypothetical protein